MTGRTPQPTPGPLLLILALAFLAAGLGLAVWLNEGGTEARSSTPAAAEAAAGDTDTGN